MWAPGPYVPRSCLFVISKSQQQQKINERLDLTRFLLIGAYLIDWHCGIIAAYLVDSLLGLRGLGVLDYRLLPLLPVPLRLRLCRCAMGRFCFP